MPLRRAVVDASAALKWVLEEEGAEQAIALLNEDVLHAPELMLLEVGNVLWSKVRRGILQRGDADRAYDAIAAVPVVLVPDGELSAAARSLAFALDVTVYDALYAALAQRMDCPLATADAKLARAIDAAGIGHPARLMA